MGKFITSLLLCIFSFNTWAIDEDKFTGSPTREGSIKFTVKRDIDTTYIRVKNEFGFKDNKELSASSKNRALLKNGSYSYTGTPGVSYKMRIRSPHLYKKVVRDHYIQAKLVKNGKKTDITMKFWIKDPKVKKVKKYAVFHNIREESVQYC